jgi:hypothetical protein
MQKHRKAGPALCPSAHATAQGARLFGVQVTSPDGKRQLAYLPEAQPVTHQILERAGPAAHLALRVAAHCIEGACPHWNGAGCTLATRVATMMPQAVSGMPRCAIRPNCLWFAQEGPAACLRCPQIATIEQDTQEGNLAAVSKLELHVNQSS